MFELSVIAYRWLCLLSFCLFLKLIMAFCPFFDWLTFVPVSFYTFQWLLGTRLFFYTGSIIAIILVFRFFFFFFFYIPAGHLLLLQYALISFWPAEQSLPGIPGVRVPVSWILSLLLGGPACLGGALCQLVPQKAWRWPSLVWLSLYLCTFSLLCWSAMPSIQLSS